MTNSKNYLKLFLLIFAIPCLMLASNDDTEVDRKILAHIRHAMRFSMYYPQEKVYLHLDNTGYFKGETIWFKAYVKRCDTDRRTDLSHVLYVELLNPSGDVVEKRKLPIVNGEANGDIKVDSIMTTGFYEIRAYTRYMTNWGTNACFSRVIPIFKAPKTEGDYSTPTIDMFSHRHRLNNERMASTDSDNGSVVHFEQEVKNDVQNNKSIKMTFYPEGGNTVKGLPARIAYSLTDKEDKPLSYSCELCAKDGKVVDSFKTDVSGRGIFSLSADSKAEYVLVKYNKDKTARFQLPQPDEEGCTMMMDMLRDDSIRASLYASDIMLGKKLGYVMIHDGRIIRCDTMRAKAMRSFAFGRDKLPNGVSQLTVFDEDGKILSERLFFIYGAGSYSPNIKIKTRNQSLRPCGKVSLAVQSEPNSSISFSAIDNSGMVNGNKYNINSWMLLSSELRGYIDNPGYYFEADDVEHRRSADVLMLVQGWRRYDWRLYSGESMFEKVQPIENKLRIYGAVKGKTKKAPVGNVELRAILAKKKDGIFEGDLMTDSVGKYVFDLPDVEGEWNLQIASKYKDRPVDYRICIDRNFVPKSRYVSPLETERIDVDETGNLKWKANVDSTSVKLLAGQSRVLKNVDVKAKKRVWDRSAWSSEGDARYYSNIYYDCDAYMRTIEDEGEYPPAIGDWLKSKNEFFYGEAQPSDVLIYIGKMSPELELSKLIDKKNPPVDTVKAIYDLMNPECPGYSEYESMPPAPNRKFYRDGLRYKNRPIVWIVDNMYVTVTGFRMKGKSMAMRILNCDNGVNSLDVPVFLDEVKSIYVSEDLEAMHKHIVCNEIDEMNPVVLYCYTHRKSEFRQKGTRYTYFEGFNTPSVFQMEDYSVVPPMEDFRRTLYWNPNVKTDKDGNATVEFYNNSSCTEISVSAEGMTEDGKYVYY